MKTVILSVICMILMCSCNNVSKKQLNTSIEICSNNGGINLIKTTFDDVSVLVFCENGTMVRIGWNGTILNGKL